jgi:hypothetical protein
MSQTVVSDLYVQVKLVSILLFYQRKAIARITDIFWCASIDKDFEIKCHCLNTFYILQIHNGPNVTNALDLY